VYYVAGTDLVVQQQNTSALVVCSPPLAFPIEILPLFDIYLSYNSFE
jgi:hypothetical protein